MKRYGLPILGAAAILGACGGVQPIRPADAPAVTTTTECQDHELPCAGPATSTTTPVDDPAHKDTRTIDRAIHDYMTTTTVALPRTG